MPANEIFHVSERRPYFPVRDSVRFLAKSMNKNCIILEHKKVNDSSLFWPEFIKFAAKVIAYGPSDLFAHFLKIGNRLKALVLLVRW